MKTYTFHVSVPDLPDTWRRVEVAAEQTLRDLHVAIQEALDWEPDDDIAFFLGGDPLGDGEQYIIFDEDGDEDEDEEDLGDEDLADEEIDALVDSLPPLDLGDTPRPESMEEMLDLLESNPEVRAQVGKMLSEQMGIPTFMVNMLLSNAKSLFSMLPEGMLTDLIGPGPEAKDATATSLEALGLEPGQSLLYMFGDDEWRFDVRVEAVNAEADADAAYPLLLDGDGPSPEQYAELEDEEDDDDDWLWGDLLEDEDDFDEDA